MSWLRTAIDLPEWEHDLLEPKIADAFEWCFKHEREACAKSVEMMVHGRVPGDAWFWTADRIRRRDESSGSVTAQKETSEEENQIDKWSLDGRGTCDPK